MQCMYINIILWITNNYFDSYNVYQKVFILLQNLEILMGASIWLKWLEYMVMLKIIMGRLPYSMQLSPRLYNVLNICSALAALQTTGTMTKGGIYLYINHIYVYQYVYKIYICVSQSSSHSSKCWFSRRYWFTFATWGWPFIQEQWWDYCSSWCYSQCSCRFGTNFSKQHWLVYLYVLMQMFFSIY